MPLVAHSGDDELHYYTNASITVNEIPLRKLPKISTISHRSRPPTRYVTTAFGISRSAFTSPIGQLLATC